MLSLIDCHAHLADSEFKEDISLVVERAINSGVQAVIVVAEAASQFDEIIELSNRYPQFCVPAFGVHPVQASSDTERRSVSSEDLDGVAAAIDLHKSQLACIGEVGLDFTPRWCSSEDEKTRQREVLRAQVNLAKQYSLPINVHSRSAGRPTVSLLKEAGADKVLLHAFDGKPSVALEGVQCGFFFSIPPSIVRSQQKNRLVDALPLDHILLESDSPALGPDRNVRNEPSNVSISCEHVAKIKKLDVATVAEVTSENALKLFPKLQEIVTKL